MTRNTKNNALLTHIKNFFTRNIAIKIVSVVFATLLWGYVLTDQKPVRVKTIQNVSTSFDGEAELLAQGLCIRGNRSDILRDVTVNVRAQINNYAYLNNRTINATVSLRNISEARTYELPVAATVSSGLGVVQTVTPSTVTVEIDNLRKKTVPVATLFVGEEMKSVKLEQGRLYNVRRATWHQIAVTPGTKVLVVDDVFDTGRTAEAVHKKLEALGCDMKMACVYWKPEKNQTQHRPDFHVTTIDKWIVFPHEIEGLSPEEIEQKDPVLAALMGQ